MVSVLHQVHKISDDIASSLEKKYCSSAVFLYVAQAFDRVWYKGLLYKIRYFPDPLYLTLNSFLSNHTFQVRCENELSTICPIEEGIPQGSILAPTIYNIYTADIPDSILTDLANFTDDTVIYSSGQDFDTTSNNLQLHLNKLQI